MEKETRQVEQMYKAILDEQRKVISTLVTRPSIYPPIQLFQTLMQKQKYLEINSNPQSKDNGAVQSGRLLFQNPNRTQHDSLQHHSSPELFKCLTQF